MTKRRDDTVPESFAVAFGGNYLGDPTVVKRLTGEYLVSFEKLLRSRSDNQITADEYKTNCSELVWHYADIISGRDPAYEIIKGYHDQTLKYKLMADLGEMWRKNRARWDDDSVCVLFEWAALVYAEHLKKADDDEILLGIMFRPTYEYFVQVILGIEKRVGQ